MNHFKVILFFFLSFNSLTQEDLVLNGGFEEYWECPDDWTQIERCKYVYNPCENAPSTSDYYNNCNFMSVWEQLPRNGDGMVGFVSLDSPSNQFHYREYIQVSLSKPMHCGKEYRITAYFNRSNLYRYTIKNIGFYFSNNEINESDYLYNLYTPQYTDTTTIISDTANWVEISFQFKADKEYNYLSIGHFLNDSTDSYVIVNPSSTIQSYGSYLYIDDVSIVEIEGPPVEFPNVFTPNNDGINPVFKPLNGISSIETIYILNRWGNLIYKLDYPFEWNGTNLNNEEVNEGVYFYRAILLEKCNEKKEQYTGMVHLIR